MKKSKNKKQLQRLCLPLMGVLLVGTLQTNVMAAPAGAEVAAGQASVRTEGAVTDIIQGTDKAIIHWQKFDIAAGERVNFHQPTEASIALNRVIGNDASKIYGVLNANGKIFLINSNGILFAPGSQVNAAGIVASVLNITNKDFQEGKYLFLDGQEAAIINQGSIQAKDYVALLGKEVKNEGIIAANVTGLAAGNRVSMDFKGDKLIQVSVDAAAAGNAVSNSGKIMADGGKVFMRAGTKETLISTVVNHTGIIEARTVNINQKGEVYLEGNQVNAFGKIDASAINGDGGFIETSGRQVNFGQGSEITAAAPQGKPGMWLVDPVDINIDDEKAQVINATLKNGTNHEENANLAGTEAGDVTIYSPLNWDTSATLSLKAARNIIVAAPIAVQGNGILELVTDKTPGALRTAGSGKISLIGAQAKFSKDGKEYTVINQQKIADKKATLPLGERQDINAVRAIVMEDMTSNYVLGDTVDASDANFIGIGQDDRVSFQGNFEGAGNTLSGIKIRQGPWTEYGISETASGRNRMGLFRVLQGEVSNLYLEAPSVQGKANVGALAGEMTGGTVANVHVKHADVAGSGQVGTLIGQMSGGMVTRSSAVDSSKPTRAMNTAGGLIGAVNQSAEVKENYVSNVTVSQIRADAGVEDYVSRGLKDWDEGYQPLEDYSIGGLIGKSGSSDVQNNYVVKTSVSGLSTVGGAIGLQEKGSAIRNTLVDAEVAGDKNVGVLVGNNAETARVIDNFWNIEKSYVNGEKEVVEKRAIGNVQELGANTGGVTLESLTGRQGEAVLPEYAWHFTDGNLPRLTNTLVPLLLRPGTRNYTYGKIQNASPQLVGSLLPGDKLVENLSYKIDFSKNEPGVYAAPVNLPAFEKTESAANYRYIYSDATIEIEKAPVSVTVRDVSRVYGDENPEFVADIEGLAPWDSMNTISFTTPAFATSNAGKYPVGIREITVLDTKNNREFLLESRYKPEFHDAKLNIEKRPITVRPATVETVYGETVPATTPVVLESGSLVDRDTLLAVSTPGGAIDAGDYIIDKGNIHFEHPERAANYIVTSQDGRLTIAPRPLEVKVQDESVVYGDPLRQGTVVVTKGALAKGDVLAAVVIPVNTVNVGEYTISGQDIAFAHGKAENYQITVSGGKLTITPRPIKLQIQNVQSVYGEKAPAGAVALTEGSLAEGDELAGISISDKALTVGDYVISKDNIRFTHPEKAKNYEITANEGKLTITPRLLKLQIQNEQIVYGDDVPAGTVAITEGSLALGDALTGVAMPTDAVNVGDYVISKDGIRFSEPGKSQNYKIIANDGKLTIIPRPIHISIENERVVYGDPLPKEARVNLREGALASGDSLAELKIGIDAVNTGDYVISKDGIQFTDTSKIKNYAIVAEDGKLTIVPRTLTLKAKDEMRVTQQDNPELTIVAHNLADRDKLTEVLSGYELETSAVKDSPVGSYAITWKNKGQQLSKNYALLYEEGKLFVVATNHAWQNALQSAIQEADKKEQDPMQMLSWQSMKENVGRVSGHLNLEGIEHFDTIKEEKTKNK